MLLFGFPSRQITARLHIVKKKVYKDPVGDAFWETGMLKSVFVLSFLWASAAITSPLAIIIIIMNFLGLDRFFRPLLGTMTQAWARLMLKMIGIKLIVSGAENIPKVDRLVFVANHPGDLDIIIMLAIAGRPVGFIAKSETAWFPFLNLWILALGSAFIKRNNLRKGRKAIEKGIRSVEKGRAIAIFPEGTRSRSFGMLPFRKGAFKLATRSKASIVPITIDGSFMAWESEKRVKAATVKVSIHKAIETSSLDTEERKALASRVESVIASALSRGLG